MPPVLFSEGFTLRAFAKVNWTLRVQGRRADGYHELETILQTVTLSDRLTFAPRSDAGLHLTSDAPWLPVGESNLVWRAAEVLRRRFGISSGASIHLEKRIPAEAGLGGGSSDAAVALLALSSLWQLEVSKAELETLAHELGADVPFFLTGGTALGTGLGSFVTALSDVPETLLLIVKPAVGVSTREAYKALNAPALTKVGGDIILSSSRSGADFSDSYLEQLQNDFEPVIYGLRPEIARVRDALWREGARGALLAGSGASVFGVFDNAHTRDAAASSLQRLEPSWRVFECATLGRTRYLKELGACARPLLQERV